MDKDEQVGKSEITVALHRLLIQRELFLPSAIAVLELHPLS